MATDTPDARMPPVASRYCYCVCDKKRRKHPGVRLQLFPKDAKDCFDTDVGVLPKTQYQPQLPPHKPQPQLPPHKPQPQPPTTSDTNKKPLRNTIPGLAYAKYSKMGREGLLEHHTS
ncbi:hypothetical protein GWK47_024907 [Chionoecetes opilio]|uniref:Uncharacterized protein n=1 Tax=Chionoecetes opilio TaxID=41210 RepID=A0A8J4XLG7_CHIOP|nr:hypothetical protein GWK47_024907 [Chionoecetes opilio]